MYKNIKFQDFIEKVYMPFKFQYVKKRISVIDFRINPLLEFSNSSIVNLYEEYNELYFFRTHYVTDEYINRTALGYIGYALIYLIRIKERLKIQYGSSIKLDELYNTYNFYNILYIAIYIAIKVIRDDPYKPKSFRNAFLSKHISTKLLLEYELKFLELIDYNINVLESEFNELLEELI
jgi:hypothetical protein